MSRLIVKNLPNQITSERLQSLFAQKGQISDLQLKYTKSGVFRKFAFVGFTTEQEAENALSYFDNTFIDSSQIRVEVCANLGDSNKPRAWSKYAEDSSSYKKKHQKVNEDILKKEKVPKNVNKKNKFVEELEGDAGFAEFLDIHKRGDGKPVWSNDFTFPNTKSQETNTLESKKDKKKKRNDAEGDTQIAYNKEEEEDCSDVGKHSSNKLQIGGDEDESYSDDSEDSDVSSQLSDDKEEDSNKLEPIKVNKDKNTDDDFTVKMNELPYNCNKRKIKDFFRPLTCYRLRIPRKTKGISGIAYVQFKSDNEVKQALNKHRSIMDGRKILLKRFIQKSQQRLATEEKWKKPAVERKVQEELLGELGRLFVRNLSYSCQEGNLQTLFDKYGPTTEVHIPIDKFTRKIKGFAYVTYMFPEHAVKAFTELDGAAFMGRNLHIIPAEAKHAVETIKKDDASFKDKKKAALKATSGSSHNWNTLFLGANAVADVVAEKYSTTKADLLDAKKGSSIAVRMALGETQVVAETREFLESRGVQLDAFSRPAGERSKTIILVKNLPMKTEAKELRNVFSRFGELNDVILPPSGITALVEFQEPAEARAAFTNLAYTKFLDAPMYLEWAPGNAINAQHVKTPVKNQIEEKEQQEKEVSNKKSEISEEEDEDDEPEPGSSIFVRNLNFETTVESLQNHFQKHGQIFAVQIPKKKDIKNPGKFFSLGYGFVHYMQKESANKAVKELQHSDLDGHSLEIKISRKETIPSNFSKRKKAKVTDQKSSKIMIRNIPFEASQNEVQELFRVFGELKAVRLPKKMAGTGKHRGFGFVDFLTKGDAKRAMKALGQSTHLYGRRLVLEWADTDDTDVDTLRKKTADHFYSTSGAPKQKRVKKSEFMEHLGVRTEDE